MPRKGKLNIGRVGLAALVLAVVFLQPAPGAAQERPAAASPVVPNFWDAKRRPDRPVLGDLKALRFVTEGRFAPLNFQSGDGTLLGFEVDLARLICDELGLTCTVQTRAFEDLLPALARGEADAAVAGLALTAEARRTVDFSERYLANPARFVARGDSTIEAALPETLTGRKVGVVEGTAHAAFLQTLFPESARVAFPTREAALAALRAGEVELVLADAMSLTTWLNGDASDRCCRLLDGAYTESAFFGEGIGVALAKNREPLRLALNYAMARIHEKGLYDELYLRYFPLGLY